MAQARRNEGGVNMCFEVKQDNRIGGYSVRATTPSEIKKLKSVMNYWDKSQHTPCPLDYRRIEIYGNTLYVHGEYESDTVFNYLQLNDE